MRRVRFGIVHLLGVILYFAIGFAALKNANSFWASFTFSLSLIAVSSAFAVALTSKGGSRASWAGFAAAGSACALVWLASPTTTGFINGPPDMVLHQLLLLYIDSINPQSARGGKPLIDYTHVCHSLEIILFGMTGAILGRLAAGDSGPISISGRPGTDGPHEPANLAPRSGENDTPPRERGSEEG
jgi:hypothetical protein